MSILHDNTAARRLEMEEAGQIVFANYWQMFTELHWRPARFDDREVGDGTALQRRGRLGWELSLSTDPRQRVIASHQGDYAHPLQHFGGGILGGKRHGRRHKGGSCDKYADGPRQR